MPDRKIHVVGDDPRLEQLAQEQVDDPENNVQYVSITPAGEESEATEQGDTTVSVGELKDLGQYLEAVRNVLLGHEERLGVIESFLEQLFPGTEDEVVEDAETAEDTPKA